MVYKQNILKCVCCEISSGNYRKPLEIFYGCFWIGNLLLTPHLQLYYTRFALIAIKYSRYTNAYPYYYYYYYYRSYWDVVADDGPESKLLLDNIITINTRVNIIILDMPQSHLGWRIKFACDYKYSRIFVCVYTRKASCFSV